MTFINLILHCKATKYLPHIEKNFNINPHVAFNDIDNIGNVGFDNLDEFINQFSNKDNVLQIGFLRFLLYINRHIKEYGLNEEESTSIKSLIYSHEQSIVLFYIFR